MTVIRFAIAVLAGYLVMTTLVVLTLTPAKVLIDVDRLRDPATGILTTWFVFMVEWPVSIFTAVVGGLVAALIAGRSARESAIRGLSGFVLVVGLGAGVISLSNGSRDAVRVVSAEGTVEDATPAEIDSDDPGIAPIQPAWDVIALPLVGAIGVVLGGRLVVRAAGGLASSLPESNDG